MESISFAVAPAVNHHHCLPSHSSYLLSLQVCITSSSSNPNSAAAGTAESSFHVVSKPQSTNNMPNTMAPPHQTAENAKRSAVGSVSVPIAKSPPTILSPSISTESSVSSTSLNTTTVVTEPNSPPTVSPRSAPDLDELVAAIVRKPRLARARTDQCSAPFWFGSEDNDHVRNIMSLYAFHMGVDANRPKNSRCPPKFIGSIKRHVTDQPVNSSVFTTLDEVVIYVRDIVPLGHPLTATQTQHVQVSWDRDDGLPTKFQKLSDAQFRRKLQSCDPSSVAYLHCLPLFENASDFSYSSDKSPRSIGYCSTSVHDDLCLIQDIKVTKELLVSTSAQFDSSCAPSSSSSSSSCASSDSMMSQQQHRSDIDTTDSDNNTEDSDEAVGVMGCVFAFQPSQLLESDWAFSVDAQADEDSQEASDGQFPYQSNRFAVLQDPEEEYFDDDDDIIDNSLSFVVSFVPSQVPSRTFTPSKQTQHRTAAASTSTRSNPQRKHDESSDIFSMDFDDEEETPSSRRPQSMNRSTKHILPSDSLLAFDFGPCDAVETEEYLDDDQEMDNVDEDQDEDGDNKENDDEEEADWKDHSDLNEFEGFIFSKPPSSRSVPIKSTKGAANITPSAAAKGKSGLSRSMEEELGDLLASVNCR